MKFPRSKASHKRELILHSDSVDTQRTRSTHSSRPAGPRPAGTAYGAPFWFAYVANTAVMIAVSLLFRYADFVNFLGGTEFNLGWIVGVGMVGSLLMRLLQGVGIDLYGARRVWLLSGFGLVLSCLGHLLIQHVDGPAIFVMRILLNTSIAGMFGASITYISSRAPAARMAEMIGMLGTSGFVGMMIGPRLGDWLFDTATIQRRQLDGMFLLAAAVGAASLVLAAASTRGYRHPPRRKQPPMAWLLRRYHPGPLLPVAVVMGFGLGLPGVFLRPFAVSLGINEIALFFMVYAPTAFLMRLATRRLPSRFGARPMVLTGLCCLILGTLLYLVVRSEWQLVMPAIVLGTAHALLFPSVVAGGSSGFPARYRGLATTLMLAMFDLGNLIGAPTVGIVLRYAGRAGLPRYPSMFLSVATLFTIVMLYYALAGRDASSKVRITRSSRRRRTTSAAEETPSAVVTVDTAGPT